MSSSRPQGESQLPHHISSPEHAAASSGLRQDKQAPGSFLTGLLDPAGQVDLSQAEAALDALLRNKFDKERERLHALLRHQHA